MEPEVAVSGRLEHEAGPETSCAAQAVSVTLPSMLADLWPTYALRIRTPRLCLRLPGLEELAALAELAARGVHQPGERPFLTPWTEGTPGDRAQSVLRGYWSQLEGWQPTDWQLGLGVFIGDEEPAGMVSLHAGDFQVLREVTTSSWLGLEHHGRGIGTEARTGLLALAFDHLGASDATTEVFPDNHASQGVSRKLGYQRDGISRGARGTEALVSDRLRLTSAQWAAQEHVPVTVDGIDAARSMFLG
jgi:RimJ/RimL family protein N-acetyltransferase